MAGVARFALLVALALPCGGCILDGCSGKLTADNAAQRMAVPFFKHPLPKGATLISRDVASGKTVYGHQASADKCAIGARQTIATKLTEKALVEHFSRVRVPMLLSRRRMGRGVPIRVQRVGKHSDGRALVRITVTDCCHNFGSYCAR